MYPDVYKAAILYNFKCTKWSKSKIVAGCQVSSLRFFMNCPCLYGLEASPEKWRSSSEFRQNLALKLIHWLIWLTWSALILSLLLSSAVRRGLWSPVCGPLRGFTARLHLMIPRRTGPCSSGWRGSRRDIQILNPIESEIPELRVICTARPSGNEMQASSSHSPSMWSLYSTC